MTPRIDHPRMRLAATALALSLLAGCTSTDSLRSSDKLDYRSAGAKMRPLEVPPDLSQLARETRYPTQGGTISAAAATATPVVAAAAAPSVAVANQGGVSIERLGQQRWLVASQTPEQLWPQLRTFWEGAGFTLKLDNPQAGLMETNWSENRAKLPNDIVRNTIGRLLGNLYDTGERDLYRTRVERVGAGSEVFVSHRGIQEQQIGILRENTAWRARPSEPELEAEMLSRLLLALGAKAEAARPASVTAAAAEPPTRARLLANSGGAAMEVDEPFDRAWRRVGLALDRSGFTVEDRDRASGLYYVRYVDPKSAGQDEPNFFARVFGGAKDPQTPVRYRIALRAADAKTTIAIQTSAGAPEAGENGQRIVSQLVVELK